MNQSELSVYNQGIKAIFRARPHLLFHVDKDGKFIAVHQDSNTRLIADPETYIGKTVKEMFPPELAETFLYAINQTLIFGYYDHEYELVNNNTKIVAAIWSRLNENEVITLVRDTKYSPTSAIDMSCRIEAEQKIRHLYRQQKLLADIAQMLNRTRDIDHILDDVLRLVGEHLDVSRVYIFEDSQNGKTTCNTFEWCNSGVLPQKDFLQNFPYERIPSWKNMLQTKGSIFSENIKELPADLIELLQPQDIKSILVYSLNVDNALFGFIGFDECERNKHWRNDEIEFLRTISGIIASAFERKAGLKKLENSNLRLKLAIEAARQGLWDWNNSTGQVYYSDTWCRMLGFEPDEIEPNISTWEKRVHPDDVPLVMQELVRHLEGETEFYETTHRMKTKEGGWKWVLDRGMVVQRDENNQPLRSIGIHLDLTRQKETERMLKESLDTKNKLFSIVAHDLRGPLSNFLPAFEMFIDEKQTTGNFDKEFFEGLKLAYQRTINLVDNLLNWSFVQTNTIKIEPADYLINDLIEENLALASENIKHKLIKIAVESDKKYFVFADKESVNLIFRNILSNAIKFTGISGTITIRVYEKGEKIAIEVADNGVGMTPEVLNKLFKSESFYSTYGTVSEKGSGIGLMLCKEFIEMNNGEIYAESTPGKGSSFTFTLERGKSRSEHKANLPETKGINKSLLKGKCLLVAEDDSFNQLFLQTMLKQWNIEVEIAANGRIVIDRLQQKDFDLILMDTEMPEMDGYETARAIRNDLKSNIPIISVSANASEKHRKYAIEAGMNDSISKPFEAEMLFSKIVSVLRLEKTPASGEMPVPACLGSEVEKLSDTGKLSQSLGNNPVQLNAMIAKFLEITPSYYREVIHAFETKDYLLLRQSSHKIKSSIELLASKSMTTNIKLINQYAMSEIDHPKLGPLIECFRQSFPKLCDELQIKLKEK